MKRVLSLSISAVLLAGCVGNTVPVTNSGASLRGKSITIVKKSYPKRPTISTDANLIGSVVGGLIGGAIIASAASKKYGVDGYSVPSNQIAERLIGTIASRYSMNYIPNAKVSNVSKGLNALSSNPNREDKNSYKNLYSTDFLLDVDTPDWIMNHTTMFTDKAFFVMTNSVKIVNRLTGKAVASVGCKYKKEWEGNIPKYEDILANNQQFIKDYTQKAIDACIAKAQREMLK